MSTQVTIPKTARDILLAKVGEFVAEATRKRTDGEHTDALSLYQRATEILQALINSVSPLSPPKNNYNIESHNNHN
jgi:hypothetical protein